MTNNRDADFTETTKDIISRRSGFRCAYLNCDKSTVGPGKGTDDIENVSVVAHIFSAAPNGPRGTGGLSVEQRKSPSNGFLVCADHSRISDTSKGKNYPASLLQSWKAMHESRIAKEMKGLPLTASAGWLQGMNFINTPLFKSGEKINFGKVTLLFGLNGTGKTAICEWLSASCGQMKLMERWSNDRSNDIRFEVEYWSPEQHKAEISLKDMIYVCKVNERSLESLRHGLRIVYLRSDLYREDVPSDDVGYLAHQWGIHRLQVPAVLAKMGSEKYGFVRKAEIVEVKVDEEDKESEETEEEVHIQIGSHDFSLPFKALSGREQGQVVLIGGMIVAEKNSMVTPTVLIVELPGRFFPDELLAEYAERLASHEFQFQTILVSPNEHLSVNWTGWSMARLKGKPPQVEIHQEVLANKPK